MSRPLHPAFISLPVAVAPSPRLSFLFAPSSPLPLFTFSVSHLGTRHRAIRSRAYWSGYSPRYNVTYRGEEMTLYFCTFAHTRARARARGTRSPLERAVARRKLRNDGWPLSSKSSVSRAVALDKSRQPGVFLVSLFAVSRMSGPPMLRASVSILCPGRQSCSLEILRSLFTGKLLFTATPFVLLQLVTPRRFFLAVVKEPTPPHPPVPLTKRCGGPLAPRRNLALHYLPRRVPTGANDRRATPRAFYARKTRLK